MARLAGVTLVLIVLLVSFAAAQNQPPISDPQAVAYAKQSMAAMTGSMAISDVTLTGNVTWSGASPDTGTATLRALGVSESRMDLALGSGAHTEVRDAQTGTPLGQWILPDGTSGGFAFHNCWTDPVWFFPALGSLASGPNVVLAYIGEESRDSGAVHHIQSYVFQPGQSIIPSPQQLSTMDFYLDTSSLLPVAATYNAHPDGDPNTNLLVEIDFSNYQAISGVVVPMHIQRYLQGNLLVDVVLSAASFNTGLTLSGFAIN